MAAIVTPSPRQQFLNDDGTVNQIWYRYLLSITGALPPSPVPPTPGTVTFSDEFPPPILVDLDDLPPVLPVVPPEEDPYDSRNVYVDDLVDQIDSVAADIVSPGRIEAIVEGVLASYGLI